MICWPRAAALPIWAIVTSTPATFTMAVRVGPPLASARDKPTIGSGGFFGRDVPGHAQRRANGGGRTAHRPAASFCSASSSDLIEGVRNTGAIRRTLELCALRMCTANKRRSHLVSKRESVISADLRPDAQRAAFSCGFAFTVEKAVSELLGMHCHPTMS